jgi:hypothetical protein
VEDLWKIMQLLRAMTPSERYTVVVAPAGFDDYPKRRNRYFKTKNAANEFRARIRMWKAQKKVLGLLGNGSEPATKADLDAMEERLRQFIFETLGKGGTQS